MKNSALDAFQATFPRRFRIVFREQDLSNPHRASTKSTGVLLLVPRKASQISDNAFLFESTKRLISPDSRSLHRAARMVNGISSRQNRATVHFFFLITPLTSPSIP